jgi:tetratricopeptide (TPR) repeat protein
MNPERSGALVVNASLLSRWSPVLLVCAGAVAYANSFAGVFFLDDYRSIVEDTRLADLQTFLAHLPGMIRPLLKATLLADRLVWGTNPAGYHLLNLCLHLGSGLLLYAILRQLVDESSPSRAAAETNLVPLVAALLFLVHPIGTETVTYLSGRATGLASFWYLAGLLLYLRASRPGHEPRALSAAQGGAIFCFVLALLSKETAITFPLALLLTELVARRTRGSALRTIVMRLHVPFWVVLLLFLGAAAMTPRYRVLFDTALNIRPLYEQLIAQVNVVAYAATLVVAPGRINFDHDFPHYGSLLTWPAPLSLALLGGMIVLAVRRARAQPLLAFGIGWFFLQLLATNSVLQRDDLLSERNLYLPAAGLFLALASAWYALDRRFTEWLSERARGVPLRVLGVLPILVVGLLVSGTVARNAVYGDPVALWTDTVNKSPAKSRPHVNLGHAYFLAGDLSRATDQFRIALTLDPDNPVAQENLRAAWERGGDRPGVAAAK